MEEPILRSPSFSWTQLEQISFSELHFQSSNPPQSHPLLIRRAINAVTVIGGSELTLQQIILKLINAVR